MNRRRIALGVAGLVLSAHAVGAEKSPSRCSGVPTPEGIKSFLECDIKAPL